MTLEEARSNIQNVLDQLRMTRVERDLMDNSLGTLYMKASEAEDLERELRDVSEPRAA